MPLGGRGLRQVGWEERNEEAGELGKEPPTRGVGLRAHELWLLNRDERGRNLGDSARPTMKTFRDLAAGLGGYGAVLALNNLEPVGRALLK
jgi:hypothetical protein